MNSIEIEHINNQFGDSAEGKTMEDYFTQIQILITGILTDEELKSEFKKRYPDILDWSF